jgi:D-alanine-D-alanine ligase
LPQKKYKITALVDSATVPQDDPQFLILPKTPTTEYYVIQTIRQLGHEVTITPVEDDIIAVANQLKQQEPSLVFNMTEEFGGDRQKDKNIAAMLELLEIPFTGTGSVGLMLCRDKILCKQILTYHQIKVPDFLVFPLGEKIKLPKSIKFPMVVKPAFEDGSEGISNASVVNDVGALKQRIQFVTKKWKQGAIAEEYIEGREFYVAILGNKKLVTLPIRECIFNNKNAAGPCLATYRVKWDEKYRRKWNVKFGFAKLDKTETEKIYQTCKQVYGLLQLRDYGRIDLRLTNDNKIVILEVNANPDVAKGEELAEAAKKAGIPYEKFIEQIILAAMARYRQQKIRNPKHEIRDKF